MSEIAAMALRLTATYDEAMLHLYEKALLDRARLDAEIARIQCEIARTEMFGDPGPGSGVSGCEGP